MRDKSFIIKVSADDKGKVFEKDTIKGELSGIKFVNYSKLIYDSNELVETLDRLDPDANLIIEPENYLKTEKTGDYGITPLPQNGDKPLAPHQQEAARRFLKMKVFLLADVVGSGKTFEACVVLSEYAARGAISSLLLIVPKQMKKDWKITLEEYFGLGKEQLAIVKDYDVDKDGNKNPDILGTIEPDNIEELVDEDNKLLRLKKPTMVSLENFAQWNETFVQKLMVDVIVVDEAHNLCGSGENLRTKPMYYLSRMMKTKKENDKPHCLLLTATPHSGDLEQMFPLWYFVGTHGGDPINFKPLGRDESKDYLKEREIYLNIVCKGSKTVKEFITNSRIDEVRRNYKEKFEEFLANEEKINLDDFDALQVSQKDNLAIRFIDNDESNEVKVAVNKAIAKAYHNGILRVIMVRQPNNLPKKKSSVVHLFAPNVVIKEEPDKPIEFNAHCKFSGGKDTAKMEVRPSKINTQEAIFANGRPMSLQGLREDDKFGLGANNNVGNYSDNLGLVLSALGFASKDFSNSISANDTTNEIYDKDEIVNFYKDNIVDSSITQENVSFQFDFRPDGAQYPDHKTEMIERKTARLIDLLKNDLKNERAIIIFDYELMNEDRIDGAVIERLQADPEIKGRLIIGDSQNKDEKCVLFLAKDQIDKVLVVTDKSFTEGKNLQECKTIINMQITPDPVAMDQTVGRIFRMGQANDVTIHSFADMDDLEGFSIMYYTRIGLITSNSGDATIIAGCNEKSVVVRCPHCGRLEMMPTDEFEAARKDHSGKLKEKRLRCMDCAKDPNIKEKYYKDQIPTSTFKCSNAGCGKQLRRSKKGYLCLKRADIDDPNQLLIVDDTNQRSYYCDKACAIRHCSKFQGDFGKGCSIIQSKKPLSPAEMILACNRCPQKEQCGDCRYGDSSAAVSSCTDCKYAKCKPKPRIITFNQDWIADCPSCRENGKDGKLKKVDENKFAMFVTQLWASDLDPYKTHFCKTLRDLIRKVTDITDILKRDEEIL